MYNSKPTSRTQLPQSHPEKNVLLIVIDGLRHRNLGCYGGDTTVSPTIDSLAGEGVTFDQAYCCSNHTDPSFTTIMSGKYPLSHGIVHHGLSVDDEEITILNETATTFLPELLAPLGYYNIAVSGLRRWHERGFDFYGDTLEEARDHSGLYDNQIIRRVKEPVKRRQAMIPSTVYSLLTFIGQATDMVRTKADASDISDTAIDKLRDRDEDNFFLLLHYNDAHYPFNPPDEFIPEYDTSDFTPIKEVIDAIPDDDTIMGGSWKKRAKNINLATVDYWEELPIYYEAGIRYADDEIGRLLDHLDAEGDYEDTVVLVTGDHGDNVHYTNSFAGHHGLYEPVSHVPLVLVDSSIPSGERVDSFIQHVDILPTVLDLLGLNVESCELDCDGKSLLPAVESGESIQSAAFVMNAVSANRFAIVDDDYKFICSLTEQTPVHAEVLGSEVRELYALDEDPNERDNLVKDRPEVAKEYENRLRDWRDRLIRNREARIEVIQSLVSVGLFGGLTSRGEVNAGDQIDPIAILEDEGALDATSVAYSLYKALFITPTERKREGSYDEDDVKKRLKELGYI